MLRLILKPLSLLPLPVVHCLGSILGYILFYSSRKSRARAIENMTQSQLFPTPIIPAARQNFVSLGKAILESFYVWNSDNKKIATLVKQVHGWEHVDEAIQKNTGIIILTPHMGCFEIVSLYFGLHHPMTALYRPPKQKWLLPLIIAGRSREKVTLAEANTSGVRKLLKTLKKQEAVGILPDQIPAAGEGEWADFFGKPAYTMTLVGKLAEKTDATIIMVLGERLSKGKGYALHLTKVDSIATTTLLNQAVEAQIKKAPYQYYWHYNRYKVSRKSQQKPQSPVS